MDVDGYTFPESPLSFEDVQALSNRRYSRKEAGIRARALSTKYPGFSLFPNTGSEPDWENGEYLTDSMARGDAMRLLWFSRMFFASGYDIEAAKRFLSDDSYTGGRIRAAMELIKPTYATCADGLTGLFKWPHNFPFGEGEYAHASLAFDVAAPYAKFLSDSLEEEFISVEGAALRRTGAETHLDVLAPNGQLFCAWEQLEEGQEREGLLECSEAFQLSIEGLAPSGMKGELARAIALRVADLHFRTVRYVAGEDGRPMLDSITSPLGAMWVTAFSVPAEVKQYGICDICGNPWYSNSLHAQKHCAKCNNWVKQQRYRGIENPVRKIH